MFLAKTHIHLPVEDAGQSAAFYEALLGAPPARQSAACAVFDFDSPPLVLTVEERTRPGRPRTRRGDASGRFSLVVTAPQHVGRAAIALRRAGVPLRLGDQAIEARDPDGNAWQVRFVESAPGRSVQAI